MVLWKLVDAVYKDCEKDGPFYIGQIKKMNLREFNNTPPSDIASEGEGSILPIQLCLSIPPLS